MSYFIPRRVYLSDGAPAMEPFQRFEQKMAGERLPGIVIRTFRRYYEQLAQGATGEIPESTIGPVEAEHVADYGSLERCAEAGGKALGCTAMLKLNGGLGTSMGLDKVKSLLEVRPGRSFLDCAARQVLSLRASHGCEIPLVLMNSFATDADSRSALARYPALALPDLPLSFLQHKYPKVLAGSRGPADWPANRQLEWNPPGHGDIYTALVTSGMLGKLRGRGVRYVFISNSDNLGATLDLRILGWFAESGLDFAMEVALRTEMDKKGGHLARSREGRFLLRESAQCPTADKAAFEDIRRHRYFNTNNLWLNLDGLAAELERHDNVIALPLIVNPKTLDPRDPSSPKVFQLETAMGAAIGVFGRTGAVVVPRERFVPVKKCNELLVLWSDRYTLTDDCRIVPVSGTTPSIAVDLDPAFYTRVSDFTARFPHGAPSLRQCTSLAVKGDVRFGRGVVAEGSAEVINRGPAQAAVADGATVTGRVDLG